MSKYVSRFKIKDRNKLQKIQEHMKEQTEYPKLNGKSQEWLKKTNKNICWMKKNKSQQPWNLSRNLPGTRGSEPFPEPSRNPWFGSRPRHRPGTYIGKDPIAKAVGEKNRGKTEEAKNIMNNKSNKFLH